MTRKKKQLRRKLKMSESEEDITISDKVEAAETKKGGKIAWIHRLRKDELMEALKDHGLPAEGTVEILRGRLSLALQGERKEIILPSPKTKIPNVEIINQARKWNVHFDGTSDAVGFLERISELAENYELNRDALLPALTELLKGKALLWHRNNRQNWRNWEDFEEDFQAFYFPTGYMESMTEAIIARKQREEENARHYVAELQTLMRRGSHMDQEDQVKRIYKNLRTEYKLYIRSQDFHGLPELLRRCEEYEGLRQEQRNTRIKQEEKNPKGKHEKNTGHRDNVAIIEDYDRNTCCWKCGLPGHNRFQCKGPIRKFCSRCGKKNVLTVECCKHMGNGKGAQPGGQPRSESPRPQ